MRSDESDNYFPTNQPYKFKVHLDTPLTLEGFWKVALIELNATIDSSKSRPKKDVSDRLIISSSLCKESILHGHEKPVLRAIWKTSNKGWHCVFETPIYLPLKKLEIREFDIYIYTDTDQPASFLKSPVTITLELKRIPFYSNYESV